ncbi:helix-turn-helix domain-containing protein [Candidatus Daviesbacteria bacterium]|nr:helix-turn-helix domain-containing protein [Candidatus Daviesbacteria bacterium]
MSKIFLREQAIKLRLRGKTYGQIKKELGVSKSTLSDWLKRLPLNKTQQVKLLKNKMLSRDLSREKFIETFKSKRLFRLKQVFEKQVKELLPLSKKELFLAGVFLYWGEGEKKHGRFSISNTDPRVIKFALYWMTKVLGVPKNSIKVRLHIYKDMNFEEVTNFWSNHLNLPKNQFGGPYIKDSTREGLIYKSFGYGTCQIYTHRVNLSEKIAMSIKAVSNYYGVKDEIFWYN